MRRPKITNILVRGTPFGSVLEQDAIPTIRISMSRRCEFSQRGLLKKFQLVASCLGALRCFSAAYVGDLRQNHRFLPLIYRAIVTVFLILAPRDDFPGRRNRMKIIHADMPMSLSKFPGKCASRLQEDPLSNLLCGEHHDSTRSFREIKDGGVDLIRFRPRNFMTTYAVVRTLPRPGTKTTGPGTTTIVPAESVPFTSSRSPGDSPSFTMF